MWRPEAHRTREEERRLPSIDQVLLVTEKAVTDAIDRGTRWARRPTSPTPRERARQSHDPTLVAEAAKELAKESGVRIEVLDADRCRALGMGSFLSVAQGSHEPPRFIVMRHRGRGAVDTTSAWWGRDHLRFRGISIKAADNMHHMKAT